MKTAITRREFLKLSGMLASSIYLPSLLAEPSGVQQTSGEKNILIIVFDAFSGKNASLHGYPRNTTPNIARIAEKAIVYHNHYAGGHWTAPATATLLTGVYPWTHRGYGDGKNLISPYDRANFFALFDSYYRIAYTHNPVADAVLKHFASTIDQHQELQSLFLDKEMFLDKVFSNDYDVASLGWTRFLKQAEEGVANSLFLSEYYRFSQRNTTEYLELFPKGAPRIQGDNYFFLEEAVDWIQQQTVQLPEPYLAYFHLLPPHAQYAPRQEFVGAFSSNDFKPRRKPEHFLQNFGNRPELDQQRINYDEYLLYVDAEFGRLFDFLEENAVLENTRVVLTSDHGEMFERGIQGHRVPTFHEPIIKVPLLIWEPGRNERLDVFSPTTAIDLLPTMLHLNGKETSEHLEGVILPPFAPADLSRNVYALDARKNEQFEALSAGTAMMLRGQHKLTYYIGYDQLPNGEPSFELYDLANDAEELENLYSESADLGKELAAELISKIDEKDSVVQEDI